MLCNLLARLDAANSKDWMRLYGGSSFDLLLHLLGRGRQAAWEKFAQAVLLHLMQGGVQQGPAPDALRSALYQGTLAENWTAAPAGAEEWIYRPLARPELNALVCLPLNDAQAWKLEQLSATLRLMDDRAAEVGTAWKPAWREFLRMSNVLQFAPGAVWVTTLGLREGLYGGLLEEVEGMMPSAAPSAIEALVAEILDPDARKIAIAAYEAGRTLPVPGYEMMDAAGEIVAMAELAWPAERVCVMTAAQAEYECAARQLGWTVFVGQASWPVLAESLDKTL